MTRDDGLEKGVEDFFINEVKKAGGFSIKGVGRAGLPDRFAFLPGGRFLLVELKRPRGGRVSPIQKAMHQLLTDLGFVVYVIATREEARRLIHGNDS